LWVAAFYGEETNDNNDFVPNFKKKELCSFIRTFIAFSYKQKVI
jgi:hypothetical protein